MKKEKRIQIYKIAAVIIAAFLAWQISVFADIPAVTDRAVVTMLGIDAGQSGGRKVSVRVLVPVAGETNFNEVSAETEKDSLEECLKSLGILKGRKIEFNSCVLLVFGKDLTKEGVSGDAKYLYTTGTLSPGVLSVVAEGTAADFVKAAADFGSETSRDLAKFLSRFQSSNQSPASVLASFLDAAMSESNASFMPVVDLKGVSEEQGGGENNGEGAESEQDGGAAKGGDSGATIKSAGTAVIFKDGRWAGELTKGETRGLIWSMSGTKKGEIQSDAFEFDGENFAPVSGYIRKKTVRVKTAFENGLPKIRYTITAKIELEPNPQTVNAEDKKALYTAIEAAFKQKITVDLESAVTASKRTDTDFFLTQTRFCRMRSKETKQYLQSGQSFLQDLIFEADVKVHVQ